MSSDINPADVRNEVASISLFEMIAIFKKGTTLFELLDTKYILAVSNQGRVSWRKTEGTKGLANRAISFEDVFEDVPVGIQESLAFHLDLFKE